MNMIMTERRPLPEMGLYCKYLRKSRDEMRQEKLYGGDVLAKHDKMLSYAAEVNGHVIAESFREVVSGETIAARPEMRRLVQQASEGEWDGVYVMAVDRLSRGSQQDQGIICDLLEITGLFIVTPNGYFDPWNPNDMDSIRYQLFNSNNEFRSYSRRMQDSIRVSVMGGQYIGRYVPFGYDKFVMDNGFKTLRPNDDAEYVRMMFDWAGNEDMSLYSIAKRLTEMGVKPPRGCEGKEWSPSTVGNILSNEVYVGEAKWGKHKTQRNFTTDAMDRRKVKRVTDKYTSAQGEWEPLVGRDAFEAVKERRAKRLPIRGDGHLSNLFAGLLVCSKCGHAMSMIYDPRYDSRRIQHKKPLKCHQKGVRAEVLEERFVEALRGELRDMEVDLGGKRTMQERERLEKAVRNLSDQVRRIDERSKFLLTMRAEQEITAEEFAEARQGMAKEREEAMARMAEAEAALERHVDSEELTSTIHRAIDVVQDETVGVEAKNRFLRSFIKRVEYTNDSPYGSNDKLSLRVVFL